MFLFTYTSAVLSIICFFIASFIFIKNRQNLLFKYFALYVFFVAIWTGANSLADIASTELAYRFWSGLIIFGASFFIAYFICFIEYFITEKKFSTKKTIIIFAPAIIISFFGFTRYFIDEVYISTISPAENSMGFFVYIMLSYATFGLLYSFIRLISHIKHTSHRKKQQHIYLTTGFLLLIISGAIFALILPLFGNYKYYSAGPQTAIFMIFLTAYAIFKYKLLNIKLIIQKSIIYLALLLIIVGLYLLILSTLSLTAIKLNPAYLPLIIIIVALLSAIGVPPLKKILKQKTDKMFFKDHMPYADAVHELNTAMNLNLEFNDLLNSTTESLYKVFKPNNIIIYLNGRNILYERKCDPELKKGKISQIDDFNFFPEDSDKLFINAEHDGTLLAQIILGEKKSGDIYLPEDRAILTTFSFQFAMALQKTYYFEQIKSKAEKRAKNSK